MSRREATEDEKERIELIGKACSGVSIWEAAALCASVLCGYTSDACERLSASKKDALHELGDMLNRLCIEAYKSELRETQKEAGKVADSVLDALGVKVGLH